MDIFWLTVVIAGVLLIVLVVLFWVVATLIHLIETVERLK